jgi:RNA polymerase sigma factor (sigma-70 family)
VNSLTDQQLLRDYTERRSEAAFAELVRRHVDFVHSAALRMVCDAHLAKDVTQGVFIALAQNARQLADRPVVSGWLHRTAQNLAANTVRSDVRRRAREQEAAAMNELLSAESDANWENIAPHLDAGLGELDEADRDALLLRYFERKPAREMAEVLGTSEDAAQKRVSRAVERLREFFSKRNVTIGAGGLAVLISANAVQSAPVGLATAISAAAVLAGATVSTSTAIVATKTIAMTTLQKTIIGATLTAAVGTGVFQAHQASQLREQVQTLQQQQAPLAEQIQQLQREFGDATNRLAGLLAENTRLKSNSNQTELLKLRGEVSALRNGANDPDYKAFKGLANRVKSLRQLVDQRPDKQIPELQFLTDKVWADVAWNADLDTEDGIRVALSNLRGEAENIFLNEMLHNALKKYLAANNDILPASLLDLKPFFNVPVTDAMLSRYELLQSGKPDPRADLVKLNSYTDEDYDSFHTITLNGASGGGFNRNQDAINDAAREFARLNNYQSPTNPAQIAPFLSRTIDPVTIQKYLNQFVMDQPSPDEIIMAPVLHAYFMAHNGARPAKGADLLPYITTPEQQAAFQRLERNPK